MDFEEDGIFFEECFLHHFFVFLRFPYPGLLSCLDDYAALPQRVQQRMLEVHHKVIQKVMYLRGGSELFYLSKEVTSHNKIKCLLGLYPDARFLLIVRQPAEFMNSLLALVRNSTLAKTGVDPTTIQTWESAMTDRMRADSRFLADLCEKTLNGNLTTQVSFRGFTGDIVKSVRYIYSQVGKIPGEAYLKHLADLKRSQGTRHRGYSYERREFEGFESFEQFVSGVENRFQQALESFDPPDPVQKAPQATTPPSSPRSIPGEGSDLR
jgi:hypothetical protein